MMTNTNGSKIHFASWDGDNLGCCEHEHTTIKDAALCARSRGGTDLRILKCVRKPGGTITTSERFSRFQLEELDRVLADLGIGGERARAIRERA